MEKKCVSQTALTGKNFTLKYHNGRKIGSQIALTEKNCDFKNLNQNIYFIHQTLQA